MVRTIVRLAAVLCLALLFSGCRGNLRENIVWQHCFARPDCGSRPCPRECPQFELPPGGPYLNTPPISPAGPPVRSTLEK